MRLNYEIKGMTCAACVSHVEKAVLRVVDEKESVNVSLLTNSVSLIVDDSADVKGLESRLSAAIKSAGYELVTQKETNKKEQSESRKRIIELVVSALFTLGVMALSMGHMIGIPTPAFLSGTENAAWMCLTQLILTLPVLIINRRFFASGARALWNRSPNMDSLICVGAGASILYGLFAFVMIVTAKNADTVHKYLHDLYFESAAMILTLVSLGKLLEARAKDKTADAIILDIRNMLRDFKIQVFDERNGTGWLRHVLIKRGFATNEVMVVLVAVNPIFKLQKPFVKKLLEMHPEIKTIVLNINDRFGPVVLGTREKAIYGEGYIEDVLLGHRFRISPRSFYQINPVQTEKLYSVAIDFAGLSGEETVLDAYCGFGSIGISASGKAKQVIGVEINKDAVKDAISNARLNKLKNCWFSVGDAGEYMEKMARDKMRPDVVFMDPPRAGSDERFIKSLIKCSPKKVVYISCNIDTQKR
ncbi:MAG: 23S rRNA (uracil(1939)-C(5))-methyltransferase RlmD, partial [Clostridia bacterium]|nr:23S rRNA (uracil(1939)-C(5))-methyltransferase RlmD [Clostridia bacterium]